MPVGYDGRTNTALITIIKFCLNLFQNIKFSRNASQLGIQYSTCRVQHGYYFAFSTNQVPDVFSC